MQRITLTFDEIMTIRQTLERVADEDRRAAETVLANLGDGPEEEQLRSALEAHKKAAEEKTRLADKIIIESECVPSARGWKRNA